MPIRMNCPACKTSINVADEKRGRKVRCRKCEEIFTVPESNDKKKTAPEANGKKTRAVESAIQSGRKIKAASTRKGDDEDEDEDRPAKKKQKKQPAKSGSGSGMMLAIAGVAAVLLLCLLGGGGIGAYFIFGSKPANNNVVLAKGGDANKIENPIAQPENKGNGGDKQPVNNGGDKPPIVQVVPIPDGPAPASITSDVVKRVKKAAVYIKVTDATDKTGEGSGFFGLEPGVVITNAHVVGMMSANSKPPKKIDVVVYSGTTEELKLGAIVLGADRDSDLAVLRLQGDLSKIPAPLPVESDCSLTEVQPVYIFGFPLGAGLGKEITVSTSSVSSIRKDVSDGSLSQIQVNGGMTNGNSGGPVVDSRGVVVGVSVAGYPGTPVNLAVPAEKIHGMLHGRVQEIALGEAFFQDKTVKLPVKISCLDPLQRVRDLKVDVWTGPAGPARRSGMKAPEHAPGDSPKQVITLTYRQGIAVHELEIPSLALPAGHVYWIQPNLTAHTGLQQWATSTTYDPVGAAPLTRIPATLKYSTAASERGLTLAGKFELQLNTSKEKVVESDNLNFQVLEEMSADPRGAALRVAMGKGEFTAFDHGKVQPRNAEAQNLVKRRIYSFTAAQNGRLEVFTFQRFGPSDRPIIIPKGKGKLPPAPPPPSPEMQIRYLEADDMASMFNATYQLASLAVPNREVKALEVWDERIALMLGGGNTKKKTTIDLIMKYTYEGSRTVAGKTEAVISIAGEVERRNAPKDATRRPKSRIVGRGSFDPASGFFSKLKLAIRDDADSVSWIFEVNLTRTAGNVYAVAPLPPRTQPNPTQPKDAVGGDGATNIAGGAIDPVFRDAAPNGGVLVGLEIGLGKFGNNDVIRAVRPVYRTGDNESVGTQFGTELNRIVKVVAKPGYAVGAITVKAGLTADGMSLTFMKIGQGKLDPNDTYESQWVGGMGGGGPMRLGGNGTMVVGIVAKSNQKNCTGLGLLLKTESAKADPKAAVFTQPAKSNVPTAYLKIVSPQGERIGQGKNWDYTGNMLAVKKTPSGVQVAVDGWALNVAAPNGQFLKVGEYLDAKRFPFNGGQPGLDFSGKGRANNTLSGEFVVWEIEMNGDQIVRLAIDFVQRANGNGAPLQGKLRINSNYQ